MEKLKARWGIKSNFQIIVIFFVFALNGSIAVRLATPVTHFFGLYQDTTNPWLFWPVRIALIFPIYQILLVVVGTLFGQHQFFWNMEKKDDSPFGIRELPKRLIYQIFYTNSI